MSTVIKSAEPCPVCLLQNRTVNYLQNRPGVFESSCAAGHKFPDTEELHTFRRQAQTKYPEFYQGPKPPTVDPNALANRDIVIDPESKKLMEEIAGITFTGAGDLKGFLYAVVEDNKTKDAEMKSLRATVTSLSRRVSTPRNGSGPAVGADQAVITIPEWALPGVTNQAEYAGKGIAEWVQEEMNNYFEGYFSGTMGTRG